ncbi:MAG: GNAT family N-acetyltransferase [Austwickia sp.]|nr:GNAT family N-acetyltransferase [Austwickia sp.]MBK8435886.1 GNAT family N-acetyltransferase [Austwickia sp.]MBK9101572.1 GNAT family N-acetyltransferase [Austwickia sp.]
MTSTLPRVSSESPTDSRVLTDGLITLRPHLPHDLAAIVEQCQDPETARFTSVPQPYTVQNGIGFLDEVTLAWSAGEPGTPRAWAIETPDDRGVPRYAGTCDYRPQGHGAAAVGYALHPWARGRGLASRALRLMCDYAFDHGIAVLVWRAYEGNWASRRTAWRCGFVVEGRVRAGLPARPGQAPRVGWIGSLAATDARTPAHPWELAPTLTSHLVSASAPRAITLRPWREDDAVADQMDPASRHFLPHVVPPTATFARWLADRRERQAQGLAIDWCIVDTHDSVLGAVWLDDLDGPRRAGSARLGLWLYPQARGRGSGRAAVRAVLAHAFAPAQSGGLGLRRIRAESDVTNLPSLRVLAASGFTTSGLARRERRAPDGREADIIGHEVLAAEYRRLSQLPPDARGAASARRTALLSLRPQVGRRLTLRTFEDADTDAVVRLLREPDMGPGSAPDAGWEAARDWIRAADAETATGTGLRWAVVVEGRPVGYVRLFGIDSAQGGATADEAELSYWLCAAARGEGLMGRAVSLAVDQATRAIEQGGLGLRWLRASATTDNSASHHILVNCGFLPWGEEPPGAAAPARRHYRYPG